MYFVYILQCDNGSYYTGITKDLCKRMKEHYYKTERCAKYTRSHNVISLNALWVAEDRIIASKLEWHIKRLSHTRKLALVAAPEQLKTYLPSQLQEYSITCVKSISLEDCLIDQFILKNHIPCPDDC